MRWDNKDQVNKPWDSSTLIEGRYLKKSQRLVIAEKVNVATARAQDSGMFRDDTK